HRFSHRQVLSRGIARTLLDEVLLLNGPAQVDTPEMAGLQAVGCENDCSGTMVEIAFTGAKIKDPYSKPDAPLVSERATVGTDGSQSHRVCAAKQSPYNHSARPDGRRDSTIAYSAV